MASFKPVAASSYLANAIKETVAHLQAPLTSHPNTAPRVITTDSLRNFLIFYAIRSIWAKVYLLR